VRIEKNRFHPTMLDDWFSFSVLILASERDVMRDVSGADIVDRDARYSLSLHAGATAIDVL
jgi:hypothetical protein